MNELLEEASHLIGELNAFARLIPETDIEQNRIINMGRRISNAQKLMTYLYSKPVIQVKEVEEILQITTKAANDMVNEFIQKEILVETTGYRRNRIFEFTEYISLFKTIR